MSSNVQSAPTPTTTSTVKISPIVIGISAAGAALVLILIMAGLCLIMQRRRDNKKSSSKRKQDMEQRPISLRSGRTISHPSNPRKNVLLTEPMPSPMNILLPPPAAQPATAAGATGAAPPPSVPLPRRRPTNTSIPDSTQSTRHFPLPRHGTTSSLVPSFVTTRSDNDPSLTSPTASSDLNHSRFFFQQQAQQAPPPMPAPHSLTHTNRRVDPVSTISDLRAQFDIAYTTSPVQAPPPPTIQQQPPPRRTEERVRADLLAALESNEPVLVVKRPSPTIPKPNRGYQI